MFNGSNQESILPPHVIVLAASGRQGVHSGTETLSNGVTIPIVSFIVQMVGGIRVWKSYLHSPRSNDLEVGHIPSAHILFVLPLVRTWFHGHNCPRGD